VASPGTWRPQILPDPDHPEKFKIPDVPIFECHKSRGFDCDEEWMERCIENQQRDKLSRNFLPRLIKGHTPENRDLRPELPAAGFLDNYKFDAARGWLTADFVGLNKETAEEIRDNPWPGRSVEVVPDKFSIPVVAMLGESPPFFKLPDIRFQDEPKALCYQMELRPMDDKKADENKKPAEDKKDYQDDKDISEKEKELFRRFRKFMEEEGKEEKKQDDEEDTKKMKKSSDDKPAKYAGYIEREKYDALYGEVKELQRKNQESEWRQKFSALRIPKGRIDVDENIQLIMDLPEAKRQNYFAQITKAVAGPTDGKVMEDAAIEALHGSDAEFGTFTKYCEENKDKYDFSRGGEYSKAVKDWRNSRKTA